MKSKFEMKITAMELAVLVEFWTKELHACRAIGSAYNVEARCAMTRLLELENITTETQQSKPTDDHFDLQLRYTELSHRFSDLYVKWLENEEFINSLNKEFLRGK